MANTTLEYLQTELVKSGVARKDDIARYVVQQERTPADAIMENLFGVEIAMPKELRILRSTENLEAELIFQQVPGARSFDALTMRVSDDTYDRVMGWELYRGVATLREAYEARACCPAHFLEDALTLAPVYQQLRESTPQIPSRALISEVVDEFRNVTWGLGQ